MTARIANLVLCALTTCSAATAADESPWWNPGWQFRTTVARTTPWRDDAPRPVEVAVDFPLLLERAGIAGQFDPGSVRVVERAGDGRGGEVPFAYRTECDARAGRQRSYLAWIARNRNRGKSGQNPKSGDTVLVIDVFGGYG